MTWYVVDGMDGSGKTTSADIIRNELESQGRKVLEITHPNPECVFGRLGAKWLCRKGTAAKAMVTFYYILDVLHSLDVKRRLGKKHDDVIFVRYDLAAAYMPEKFCPMVHEFIKKVLPVPDVRIFVDIEPRIAMQRILARGEELEAFENEEELEHTRKKMKMLLSGWHVIDNSGSEESTEQQTLSILREVSESR